MMNITLELSVNDVNTILRSLGQHPFDAINELITKIKTQGETQLEAFIADQKAKQEAGEAVTIPVPAND